MFGVDFRYYEDLADEYRDGEGTLLPPVVVVVVVVVALIVVVAAVIVRCRFPLL